MRVLVVDDTADVRFMLRFLLEEAGMTVDEASSGHGALEQLNGAGAGCAWDVVVLDQRMPGMTGIEVVRELAGTGAELGMILFSAYLHPSLQAEAERLGATTVAKTELGVLVKTVQKLVGAAAQATSCTAARTVESGSPFSR